MKLRILLCDDQPDVVRSLALLLETQGYETALCSSGRAGIEKARQWQPHLAFIDIGMPDVTGYAVCAEIRRMPFGKDITLVAFTGYGAPEDVRLATEAGFDQHVQKGADPLVLVEIAARVSPKRK
jgi:CheY-like chemotaxis protein